MEFVGISSASSLIHTYTYCMAILRQDWGLLCSRCIVFSQIFPKTSHRRVKVSVNKRDTSRFQQWASTRPPEPAVGEYSSLLTKSFWLQRGRSEGLFLWPAGLHRNHSGLFGSCELEGWGSMIIIFFKCVLSSGENICSFLDDFMVKLQHQVVEENASILLFFLISTFIP